MTVAAAAPRRSYTDRVEAALALVNRIAPRRDNPHAFIERRDEAARELAAIARALRVDGL